MHERFVCLGGEQRLHVYLHVAFLCGEHLHCTPLYIFTVQLDGPNALQSGTNTHTHTLAQLTHELTAH